jgi:hypothetical protein
MNSGPKSYDPTTLGVPSEDEPDTLRDAEGNVLPTFDAKHAEPFKGLLYLGALADNFDWLGHSFDIRTLRDGEKLAVATIIKPYIETMGADRAYANAMVGMCITGVDGDDLPIPIGETKRAHEWGRQRFDYVKDNWYSSTIDVVFNRYLILEDLAMRVLDAMGKASAPEDSNLSSSDI